MRSRAVVFSILLAGLLLAAGVQAATDLAGDLDRLRRLRESVELTADDVEYARDERKLIARGGVRLRAADRLLQADEVVVDVDDQTAVATGNVVILEGLNRLEGERIEYNYRTGLGVITNGRAQLDPGVSIRGVEIRRQEARQYTLKDGAFTSCTICQAPGTTPDWEFRADEAVVYQDEWITASHTSMWVKGIPAFYFPVVALPIGPRRTGFLIPRFGYSGSDGLKVKQPFFWAISPSQDLTVTTTYRTKRGFELEGEYRYMLGEHSSGSLKGRYLHDLAVPDSEADSGEIRWLHNQTLTPESTFKGDVNYVSNPNIYRNFIDSTTRERTQRTTNSNVYIDRTTAQYMAVGLAQVTQDLTATTTERTSRIPEGLFQWLPAPILSTPVIGEGGSSLAFLGSDSGEDLGRFDLYPAMHLPLSVGPWLNATSSLAARETAYTEAAQSGGRNNRVLGEMGQRVLSRFFRRFEEPGLGLQALTHVVEPSAQYLYVPWVDQQTLPQFDRADFVSPQNRVIYQVANRFIASSREPDGSLRSREVASLGIAQSWNLQPRTREFSNVYLDGLTPERVDQSLRQVQPLGNGFSRAQERPLSNLVVMGGVSPHPAVGIRAALGLDLERTDVEVVNTVLSVGMGAPLSLEVGQTFVRNQAADGVVGRLLWQATERLHLDLTTRFDTYTGSLRENGIGFRYTTCCWEAGIKYTYRDRGPGYAAENDVSFTIDLKTTAPGIAK
jgi:LPS-assembly protein